MRRPSKVRCLTVSTLLACTAAMATARPGTGQDQHSELAALKALYARGEYADALAEASRILSSRPTGDALAEALLVKGLCHAKHKEWEEALVSLKSLVVLAPDSPQAPEAAYAAALIHLSRREPDDGRAIFKDLIRRWPQSAQAQRARRFVAPASAGVD